MVCLQHLLRDYLLANEFDGICGPNIELKFLFELRVNLTVDASAFHALFILHLTYVHYRLEQR